MRPVYIHQAERLSPCVEDLSACAGMSPDHAWYPALTLSDFNPRSVIPMMKMRRMDRASRMLIWLLRGLIGEDQDCRDWGLFIGTYSAGSDAVEQFLGRYLEEGPLGANPMVFPNTVLNAAAGQAAIFYGLEGPNSTHCMNFLAGVTAVQAAYHHLQFHDRTMLAGAVDVLAEHQMRVWQAHPDYGLDGFVMGEGAAVVKLGVAPSSVLLKGFSQGRLAAREFEFTRDLDGLSEVLVRHMDRFGPPHRVYPFGYTGRQIDAQKQIVGGLCDATFCHLGERVGLSSTLPVHGICHAASEVQTGQEFDVLAFGLGGDYLVTRVSG